MPNKTTLAREAEIAAKQHAAGLKLGKDIMQQAANYFFGLAARYQVEGPNPDEKKFQDYLRIAANIAKDLAPYESPRLATLTVHRQPVDLSRLTDAELADLRRLRQRSTVSSGDGLGSAGSGASEARH